MAVPNQMAVTDQLVTVPDQLVAVPNQIAVPDQVSAADQVAVADEVDVLADEQDEAEKAISAYRVAVLDLLAKLTDRLGGLRRQLDVLQERGRGVFAPVMVTTEQVAVDCGISSGKC